MLGKSVDYYLLKPLVHSRNRATEAECNYKSLHSTFTEGDARIYLERFRTEYFQDRFKISPKLSYLDIGCGMGRLSIGLGLAGARDVTGIDLVERHIEEARACASRIVPQSQPDFHQADINLWKTERQYDVIISLGALEHIHDPGDFLLILRRLLKPDGLAFVSFEPFQSPIGDHMNGFFRVPIPWRGLIFSEQAILRLRSEYYRPTDPAERYQDIVGGLNLMTLSQYVQYLDNAGLEIAFQNINPQLRHHKRFRPLYPFSWLLTRIPRVRNYFSVCIYSILKRRDGGSTQQ